MEFISTDHGHIPRSRIVRLYSVKHEGKYQNRIDYTDGTEICTAVVYCDEDEIAGTPIPASPGYYIVSYSEDIGIYKQPVVAWTVRDEHAYPVTVEDRPEDWSILCPDGRVFEPYIRDYPHVQSYAHTKQKERQKEVSAQSMKTA